MWANSHTTLLSDVYNRAEIDFYNCQSVQVQMNYNAARLDISHIILKIVNNALLKCKILHIKNKKIKYIIKLLTTCMFEENYFKGRYMYCHLLFCYFEILSV